MKNWNALLLSAVFVLITPSFHKGGLALPGFPDQGARRTSATAVFGAAMVGPDLAATGRLKEASGRLPLSFVPNAGQMDPTVLFQVRSPGATLFFTTNEIILSLTTRSTRIPPEIRTSPAGVRSPQPTAGDPRAMVRLVFESTNPATEVQGEKPLPGTVNYFSGNDPKHWYTNLPTYGGVAYRQLYPGIDLHYDGANRTLKATYLVAPGADPAVIRWSYDGASHVRVEEASGDLLVQVPASGEGNETIEFRERAPVAWQEVAGQRRPVAVRYDICADGTIGFTFPAGYDRNQPLTIDPVLFFRTYLGGSGDDVGLSIALDLNGNIYVAGYTTSQNFPTPTGYQTVHNVASNAAFVTKFNPDASAIIYSTYLGGWSLGSSFFGEVKGRSLAVDLFGSAYLTGYTVNTHLPTTLGAFQTTFNLGSPYDAFVTKLSPDGSALVYSTYLGGAGDDFGMAIGLDLTGAAYVTGYTTSGNFPTSPTAYKSFLWGTQDVFVTKMKPDGSGIVYSTYLGGTEEETGRAIAVDLFLGYAYITGDTNSSTSFKLYSAYQSSFGGGWTDAFVSKLSAEGSQLIYSTFLGGSGSDFGNGIAFDVSGNVYVTGETDSTNFPLQNPIQAAKGGGVDAFVAKLNAAGSALEYSTYLGGNGEDKGTAIALDWSANAYVTGYTTSNDFPLAKASSATYHGNYDAFLTEVNAAGSALVYSTYLGGSTHDEGWGIAVDAADVPYLTGFTGGSFPALNAFQPGYGGGGSDAFLVKLGMGSTTTAVASAPNPSVFGQPVNFTAQVTWNVGGSPPGTVRFMDGTTVLGTSPTNPAGQAIFSTTGLAVGAHAITAEYVPNDAYNGSTSAGLTQTVNKANTTTTIISSAPNPSSEGQAVTVNFALTVTVPGAGVPTDSVTVSDGTIQCLAVLPATSCNLTFTSPGVRNLTAAYAGDANFNMSTSPAVVQAINNLVPTITSISPTWSAVGGPGFTLTVNGTNFFDGTMVRWNGSDRVTTFVNSTQLTAFIPATDLKTVGTVSITVAHPGPTGDVSNTMTQRVSADLFLPLILR